MDLVNAGDVNKAVQLSGREFKGSTLKVEVSHKKPQTETPGKAQEKGGKAGKAGKGKPGEQEQSDAGDLGFLEYCIFGLTNCFVYFCSERLTI